MTADDDRGKGEEEMVVDEDMTMPSPLMLDQLKDEFLTTLSHEIRSPMNAILGWVSLLRRGKLKPDEVEHALEIIERNARRQARLFNDLLDVSDILNGRMQLHPHSLLPVYLIEEVIESFHLAVTAKAIDLQTELDPYAGPVLADASRLQSAIWNLLSNAIKFTPQGGAIRVRLARRNGMVEIAVSDTGVGIDADFLPHVFDRFRQEDSSSTRQFGGLGLGLALVRHLIELHGGTVSAESAGIGQGATFTLRLPMLTPSADSLPHRSR